jgi:hypothetical protein
MKKQLLIPKFETEEEERDTLVLRSKKNDLLTKGGAMAQYTPKGKVDVSIIRDTIDYSDLS